MDFDSQDLGQDRICAIACRTTGWFEDDRIVSLAIVHCNGFMPTGECAYLLFNPERPSHPSAQVVHGWSEDALSRQPVFATHAGVLAKSLGGALLVGHNIGFDMHFLRAEFARLGQPPPWRASLCSMEAARAFWPDAPVGLDDCLQRMGRPPRSGVHGPLGDAFLTVNVLRHVYGLGGFVRPQSDPPPLNLAKPAG